MGDRLGLTPVAAAGRFLVVPVRVTNLRARPASFIAAGQIVAVDTQGRTYEIDPRASDAAYLLDFGLDPSFGPRQPGIAYPDVLVFDLPPELDAVAVEAVDGSLSINTVEPPSTPSAETRAGISASVQLTSPPARRRWPTSLPAPARRARPAPRKRTRRPSVTRSELARHRTLLSLGSARS